MKFIQKSDLKSDGNNCFISQPKEDKIKCPICHEMAKGVLSKTLHSLVKEEIKSKLICLDGFYYCKTPSCTTVYFRADTVLTQVDVSVSVGLKDGAEPASVCYCFDWTKEKIKYELLKTSNTIALEDIKAKMKVTGCSCEILNPSGGCCLADTNKAIKEIKQEIGLII